MIPKSVHVIKSILINCDRIHFLCYPNDLLVYKQKLKLPINTYYCLKQSIKAIFNGLIAIIIAFSFSSWKILSSIFYLITIANLSDKHKFCTFLCKFCLVWTCLYQIKCTLHTSFVSYSASRTDSKN